MKRILLVLAALAMFAGCKKDSKNEVPTGSFDFTGTMNVVYFDVDYKSEDVVITVDYDKDSGKAELLLHQVKFVPMMPVTLDVLIPDVTARVSGETVTFSGTDIIPLMYPSRVEVDRYPVTGLSGTMDGEKLSLSLRFGDYPTTYTGALAK